MQSRETTIGIDVSKAQLEVYELATGKTYRIANTLDAISQWLDGCGCDKQVRFALEPTNRYHQLVAQLAHARGHAVYLVDTLRLAHYRQGVGQRVKADRRDAQLLARYLDREVSELRR